MTRCKLRIVYKSGEIMFAFTTLKELLRFPRLFPQIILASAGNTKSCLKRCFLKFIDECLRAKYIYFNLRKFHFCYRSLFLCPGYLDW